MTPHYDCFECVFKQMFLLSRTVSEDDGKRKAFMGRMLKFFTDRLESATPPELAEYFFRIYSAERQEFRDDYALQKSQSTDLGLALLPELRQMVEEAGDPFECAVLLAIAGNIIDYGATPDFDISQAEAAIRNIFKQPFDREAVAELHRRMERAGKILYILDNCGEAVIDRLLMERYADKITAVVRGGAIYNDVTAADAAASGIDFVPVIDTGHAAPGVVPDLASPELAAALAETDLIVAKGQGNFESLEGEITDKPIFFLLRVKCPVVGRYLKAELGSPQIIGRNLD